MLGFTHSVLEAIHVCKTIPNSLSNLGQTVGDFINFYWITFRSNLGGAPPKIAGDDKTPLRVIVFAIFFASTIVWMAYRLRDFPSLQQLLRKNLPNLIQKGIAHLRAGHEAAEDAL